MEKSAARTSAKSQRSHGGGDLRQRSRHPSPPDHENNLVGDGDDREKESLSTASDVRDQATRPTSEESEPVGLRTRSKLVIDGGDVEYTSDDSDTNEDEKELDPASRHNNNNTKFVTCRVAVASESLTVFFLWALSANLRLNE